jgi:hypothetical protein
VLAQNPNSSLDSARRTSAVAAQKLEADVNAALNDTRKVGPDGVATAVKQLSAVLANLTDDQTLTPTRRASLTRQVRNRLRDVEAVAAVPTVPTVIGAPTATKATTTRQTAEADDLRQRLDAIATAQNTGKQAEALKLANDLMDKYPDHPAVLALYRQASMSDRVTEAKKLLAEYEKRTLAAMRDVDRSAQPPLGDIEFPKDWKERTAKRDSLNQLSAKEKAVLKALDTPVPANFKEMPFRDVMDYLSNLTNQPIMLNKGDLAEAQLAADTPITLQPKGVTMRTVLRKVLGDFGLTYVVQEGTIQVVTQLKARETMITKIYPISDVVGAIGPVGGGAQFGPQLAAAQAEENARQIAEAIMASIDPSSWKTSGGQGAIRYHAPSMTLIIRQTAEVHALLKTGFRP